MTSYSYTGEGSNDFVKTRGNLHASKNSDIGKEEWLEVLQFELNCI